MNQLDLNPKTIPVKGKKKDKTKLEKVQRQDVKPVKSKKKKKVEKEKPKIESLNPVASSDSKKVKKSKKIKVEKEKHKIEPLNPVAASDSKKVKKQKQTVVKKLSDKLGRDGMLSADRLLNTPGATACLLAEEVTNTNSSLGSLLTRGLKFSSTNAFLRFVGLPAKRKRTHQKLEHDPDQSDLVGGSVESGIELKGAENEGFKADTPGYKKEIMETSTPKADDPPAKKRKLAGLDISKLKEHLAGKFTDPASLSPTPSPIPNKLADSAKQKLSASRFRYLNEKLYCQEGAASASLFKNDSSLFSSYHAGYQIQARQWPIDPLNLVIADILKMSKKAVIADFGCGEARLSKSVPNLVHSFDFVAANESVTACDMSKVPLESNCVDVAVFCLSLMGTNIRDFIFEASRVLKVSGTLKIAELESRFQGQEFDVDQFISDVEKFGFKSSWKDLKKDFFYFLDFQKVKDVKKKKKLPDITLKPCLYKKR